MIMKNILNKTVLLGLTTLMLLCACNNDQSYADRLNEERNAVNSYLSNHRVEMKIPKDSVFEVGENAPFYRVDPDGNVYMQVLNAGDRKNTDGPRALSGDQEDPRSGWNTGCRKRLRRRACQANSGQKL